MVDVINAVITGAWGLGGRGLIRIKGRGGRWDGKQMFVLVVWREVGMQEGSHTIVWMSQVSLKYSRS